MSTLYHLLSYLVCPVCLNVFSLCVDVRNPALNEMKAAEELMFHVIAFLPSDYLFCCTNKLRVYVCWWLRFVESIHTLLQVGGGGQGFHLQSQDSTKLSVLMWRFGVYSYRAELVSDIVVVYFVDPSDGSSVLIRRRSSGCARSPG